MIEWVSGRMSEWVSGWESHWALVHSRVYSMTSVCRLACASISSSIFPVSTTTDEWGLFFLLSPFTAKPPICLRLPSLSDKHGVLCVCAKCKTQKNTNNQFDVSNASSASVSPDNLVLHGRGFRLSWHARAAAETAVGVTDQKRGLSPGSEENVRYTAVMTT